MSSSVEVKSVNTIEYDNESALASILVSTADNPTLNLVLNSVNSWSNFGSPKFNFFVTDTLVEVVKSPDELATDSSAKLPEVLTSPSIMFEVLLKSLKSSSLITVNGLEIKVLSKLILVCSL